MQSQPLCHSFSFFLSFFSLDHCLCFFHFFSALNLLPLLSPPLSFLPLFLSLFFFSNRAPLAATELQCLHMLQPSPKFIICVHSVHALRPHRSRIPAKSNVTAPPQPSFIAITGQTPPFQGSRLQPDRWYPSIFLCVHTSLLLLSVCTCNCTFIQQRLHVCV